MLNYKDKEEFLNPIISAINKGELILFVGSGLSKLCGLPLWKELASSLLGFCAEDVNCEFSYNNYNEILTYIDDERELISIGKNLLRKTYNSDDEFNKFLYNKLHLKKPHNKRKNKAKEIQELLFGIAKIIFTTNADDILDQDLDKSNIIISKDDIGNYKSDFEHKVIHLHGSIKKPCDLVFTTADYLKRYASDVFRDTIKSIFSVKSHYTILFIGYGFREMQLLDFLVNVDAREVRKKKTFVLNGYYSNQENIFEVESDYYSEYGVTLVSYSKDEKNFGGLIDALKYIQKEANEKSLLTYNNINKLNEFIKDKPTKEVIIKIRSEIRFLAEQQKIYLVDIISKSENSKLWAENIILDKTLNKEFFSLDFLINNKREKNFDEEEYTMKSFPGLNLLIRVDCYTEKTKRFFSKFINNLAEAFLKNDYLYLYWKIYKDFLQLLFSNKDFLANDIIIEYLKKFIKKSAERDLWILFSSFNNEVLKSLPKNESLDFFSLMLETLKYNKKVTYDFITFAKTYSDYFCTRFSKDIFNILMPIEISTFNENYYSYDTFEAIFFENNELFDIHTYLKKWLGKTIKNLSEAEVVELYKNLSCSKEKFEILTSIYIANVHFKMVGTLLLDSIQNLISDKIYFSEIFSAIRNNISKITPKQLNKVLQFIDNLKYENNNINIICKLHLIHIIEDSSLSNNEIISRSNDLNNYLTIYNLAENYKNISPLDISKSFYISTSRGGDEDIEETNKILSMGIKDFILYLKKMNSPQNKFHFYNIFNNLDKIIDKFDLLNKDVLKLFSGVSNDFLEQLESRIINQKIDLKKKFELIKEIENIREKQNSNRVLLNSLYFGINYEKTIDNELKNQIFNYVNTIEVSLENRCIKNEDLFSNEIFLKVSILIKTCPKKFFKVLFDILNSYLKVGNNSAKAAICGHINYLWFYDKEWTLKNLKDIFNNEFNSHNISFYAFSFSLFYNVDFVNALDEEGILAKLLSSNDFEKVAYKYGYYLMCNFIYSKEDENVINAVANIPFCYYSLVFLIDYIEKTKRDKFDKNKFDKILEIIMLHEIHDDTFFHCGIALLKFLNEDEINLIEEKFIISSFSYRNSSFYCKKLFEVLSSKKLDKKILDKFVRAFLLHLKDSYYDTNEIKKLFDLIQSKEIKTVIINTLGNINPHLLNILKV